MTFLVGLATCIAGIILVLRHLHLWRKQTDAASDRSTRTWLNRQLRRRTLTSTCIAVLGFVICLLHFREFWQNRPTGWVILLSCAIALVFMIFVLASLDFLSVSTMLRSQQNATGQAAERLVHEYFRLKRKAAGDGGNNSPGTAPGEDRSAASDNPPPGTGHE
jgi:hypothetical protein